MKHLVDAQRKYFNSGCTKSVDFRIDQLRKLKAALMANENAMLEAIALDFKKSAFDAYTTEIGIIYHDIQEAISNVKQWSKVRKVKTNLINFPAKSYIIPEPLGVSLIIGAWNYPYLLSLAPVVAAMAAGNTIILKPSELPRHTSNLMAEIISENYSPEYFAVVEGGINETTELLNQRFDKIFFTGSVPVGRIVYQAAARHLTPVTLELGGKSPALVTADCNLKVIVKRLVWAKFLNAGQTCIAPDYVWVHTSVYEQFLQLVKDEILKSSFSVENGNYVQIISQKHLQRLVDLMAGTEIYFGGRYDIDNRIVDPTVITGCSFDHKIMQEEIFGPLWPVVVYDDIDKAIEEVKKHAKPLSCYVFTNDKKLKNRILTELSFGGGCVNDAMVHVANSNLPFGGVGESGIGYYHGEYGFRAFSHYKSIHEKTTWFEPSLKYHPHTASKFKWIKWILRW